VVSANAIPISPSPKDIVSIGDGGFCVKMVVYPYTRKTQPKTRIILVIISILSQIDIWKKEGLE